MSDTMIKANTTETNTATAKVNTGTNDDFSLTKKQKTLAWGILLTLSLIWGSSFILIKKGLAVYSPAQVGALRVISGFVFLLGLVIYRFRKIPRAKWGTLFISGMAGIFVPAFLFPLAQTHVDSAITGVLNALTPMSALIIGTLAFHQKTSLGKVIGVVVGFIGITILIFTGSDGNFSFNAYALYVVAATVCYGFNLNYIKRYLSDLKSIDASIFAIAFVGPLAIVYLFSTDFTTVYSQKEGSLFALAMIGILGVFGTALSLILFNKLLQMTNPIFTSSVTYLIPIIAIIWGVADGEKLLPSHYIGILITIAGVWLVNRKQ